jgi:purine-nucleoside/S-methyl-5'-thioadenosine phosphorylase / adenosine deaminase
MVKIKKKKRPEKLEFTNLKVFPEIVHSVFTRRGGVSNNPFDSLNVSFSIGDKEAFVAENRGLILNVLDRRSVPVFLDQVHGDNIIILENNKTEKFLSKADGIITNVKGKLLFIQVADCQSVMMFDPVKKVIANVHNGWRGSIKNVIGKCVDKMGEKFGTNPEHIVAGISPSLGPCCAEFINYKKEIPENLWKYKAKDSFNFDFWELSFYQLLQKGVRADNIENMNICTKCFSKTFFSYREEKQTGRFACVIGLI